MRATVASIRPGSVFTSELYPRSRQRQRMNMNKTLNSSYPAHPQLRGFSYTPLSPPPLFDLCVRKAFDEALQRAQTHPHEAAFKHPRNWTALHCCVEHVAPIEVVKAIYNAYPPNVNAKDWQGITPAEAAVDRETVEFLNQQANALGANNGNAGASVEQSSVAMETAKSNMASNDPNDIMMIGKVINHANNLSIQVQDLSASTERLRKELEDLKATLRTMSSK